MARIETELFSSDARCSYCGEWRQLQRDHIIPRCKGGSDDKSNIAVSCWPCNRLKSGLSLDEARLLLNQRRFGWPRFNLEQVKWLKQNNFDISLLEGPLLFEEDCLTGRK